MILVGQYLYFVATLHLLASLRNSKVHFLTDFSIFPFRFSDLLLPDGLVKQGWMAAPKGLATLPKFSAAPGPRGGDEMASQGEVFDKIFKSGLSRIMETTATFNSTSKKMDLTINEKTLVGFIAMELVMRLVPLHRQEDYWAGDSRSGGLFPSHFVRQFFTRQEYRDFKQVIDIERSEGTEWVNSMLDKFWIAAQFVILPCPCSLDLT